MVLFHGVQGVVLWPMTNAAVQRETSHGWIGEQGDFGG
jgi:hypothetical protein